MNKIKYNSMLVQYIRLPLYLIPFFIVGIILLFVYNHFRIGYALIGCLVIYTGLVIALYVIIKKSIDNSVLNFAMGYAGVQKSILENLDVPYALITADGKFLWMNKEFEETTGKDKTYQKSVTTIFPQITKEKISRLEGELAECQKEIKKRDEVLIEAQNKLNRMLLEFDNFLMDTL